MPSYAFAEYLSANAGRAYPLGGLAGRLDVSGAVVLPDALLVDARVNAPPAYAAGTFFVANLGVFEDGVSVTLAYDPGDGTLPRPVAVVGAVPAATPFGTAAAFTGAATDLALNGTLTFGDLGAVVQELAGFYDFTSDQTPLESAVLCLGTPMVAAVELYDGDVLFGSYPDVLRLRAGRNCQWTRVDATTVRLDVEDGLNTVTTRARASSPRVRRCARSTGSPRTRAATSTSRGASASTWSRAKRA